MDALIAMLIQYLPKQIDAIKYLQYAPDAIATVKELVAYVKRTIEILRGPNVVLSPKQEAVLDAAIDALSNDPYWEEDPQVES